MTDKQEPVDCIHPREIMQYTGDGDEVAFCPECGQNRLTGHSRANRPADDGLVALADKLERIAAWHDPPQFGEDEDIRDALLEAATTLRAQSDAEVERMRGALIDLTEAARSACNAAQHPPLTEALAEADYLIAALERGEHRKDGV